MIHLKKISAAWKIIDTNGDNKISKAEFSNFLGFLFPEESIPHEKTDELYNSIDLNNDFQWAKKNKMERWLCLKDGHSIQKLAVACN